MGNCHLQTDFDAENIPGKFYSICQLPRDNLAIREER